MNTQPFSIIEEPGCLKSAAAVGIQPQEWDELKRSSSSIFSEVIGVTGGLGSAMFSIPFQKLGKQCLDVVGQLSNDRFEMAEVRSGDVRLQTKKNLKRQFHARSGFRSHCDTECL